MCVCICECPCVQMKRSEVDRVFLNCFSALVWCLRICFYEYGCFAWIISGHHVCACRDWKRQMTVSHQLGPLTEQPVLLTTEFLRQVLPLTLDSPIGSSPQILHHAWLFCVGDRNLGPQLALYYWSISQHLSGVAILTRGPASGSPWCLNLQPSYCIQIWQTLTSKSTAMDFHRISNFRQINYFSICNAKNNINLGPGCKEWGQEGLTKGSIGRVLEVSSQIKLEFRNSPEPDCWSGTNTPDFMRGSQELSWNLSSSITSKSIRDARQMWSLTKTEFTKEVYDVTFLSWRFVLCHYFTKYR